MNKTINEIVYIIFERRKIKELKLKVKTNGIVA